MFDGRNFNEEPSDLWLRNLLIARRRWEATPIKEVAPELGVFRSECRTLACFGGHVACWPEFQAQGVHPSEWLGAPQMREPDGMQVLSWHVAGKLFGDCNLFSTADEAVTSALAHAEVLRRLDIAIAKRRQALATVPT